MSPELKAAYQQSLDEARSHYSRGDLSAAFASLEVAHILGQQFLFPHIAVHVWMFRVGAARRDKREMFGQIVRLLATIPGFFTGWVPLGNTGGANVSALKPMPVPETIADLVPRQRYLRQLCWRLAVLIVVAVVWALLV